MGRNLKDLIKLHVRSKSDLERATVIASAPGGNWLVKQPGCDTPILVAPGQGGKSYAPGMSVNLSTIQGSSQKVISTLPPPGRRGASSFPLISLGAGNLDGLVLLYAEPNEFNPGDENISVILNGMGFIEDPVDIISFVLSDGITSDPYITINGVTIWISETQVEINITVSDLIPPELLSNNQYYDPYFNIKRGE